MNKQNDRFIMMAEYWFSYLFHNVELYFIFQNVFSLYKPILYLSIALKQIVFILIIVHEHSNEPLAKKGSNQKVTNPFQLTYSFLFHTSEKIC